MRARTTAAALLLVALIAALMWGTAPWRGDDLASDVREAPSVDTEDEARAAGPRLEGPAVQGHADGRPRDPTADAPASAAPRWQLTGLVSRDEDEPVSGATVTAVLRRGAGERTLPTATTGDDGRYTIDLTEIASWPRVRRAGAEIALQAFAPGHVPSIRVHQELVEHDPPAPVVVDLGLYAGACLVGRVVDTRGAPVEGVEVHRMSAPRWERQWKAITDDAGRYVLSAGEPGRYRLLVVDLRGVAQSDDFVVETDDVTLPDLVLRTVATIEGIVVRGDGTPLRDVELYADWSGGAVRPQPGGTPASFEYQPRTTTGPAGRFVLPVHRQGAFQVHLGGTLASRPHVPCEAGDRDVRLVVDDHRLHVRVLDSEGQPLPGATVAMVGWPAKHASVIDDVLAGRVTMDKARQVAEAGMAGGVQRTSGVVSMFVVPGSVWWVHASVPDCYPAEVVVRTDPSKAATHAELVVRDPVPIVRLALHVLGPDGRPVPRFALSVQTVAGSDLVTLPFIDGGSLPMLPEGRFRIRVVPVVVDSYLEREHQVSSFLLPAERVVDLRADRPAEVTLRVAQGGRFRLHLEFEGSDPPPNARVHVMARRQDVPEALPFYAGLWIVGEGEDLSVTSRFPPGGPHVNVELLAPGDYEIDFRVAGYGKHRKSVRIVPGEIADVTLSVRKP